MGAEMLLVRPEMFDSHPAAAPQILLDSRLGKDPETTNFDFDVFYELAREAGLNNEQITSFTEIFSAESSLGSEAGFCKGNTATVSVPTCLELADSMDDEREAARWRAGFDVFKDPTVPNVIREVAIHELGHYVDNTISNGKRNLILKRARTLATPAVAVGLMTEGTVNLETTQGVVAITAGLLICLGSVASAAIPKKLTSDRVETPAYRFEEQYGHIPILNFDPR